MIGIAIRACFGKPAFEIMQQGQTPAGMKNEAFPEKTMIFGLFRKKNNNQAIVDRQYAALTAAARMPEIYERLNVPDTVMGRFEMLSIAMILFFRRTRVSATSGQEIAQEIVDAFFQDIDYSIRELGIGDNSVPKRMKKLAGMFYGRLEAYSKAMDTGDAEALAFALQRNIYPETSAPADMTGLAGWMMAAESHLSAVPEEVITTGSVALPAVACPPVA
ncbi:ubiquinol-cytochrome C chaperone family protein [Rhizobium leguminosarum]|uniref:Ubiquinol-cytochrome C chaperone family protein n=1 Tax=Rhizobium leguminosarum TaxID=384 RepID=A0A2Z4YLC2_RHILE|nr:ubiquinol-cytochrome C chaperone family protein [Rhizobium leguminosarum]AXA42260.1 Ubiquinol-cytochrome C chaperone family protein [Rhizobium leguminosarum]